MILGPAADITSLYEKIAPHLQGVTRPLDALPVGLEWLPRLLTLLGFGLIAAIYQRTRANRPVPTGVDTQTRYFRGQTIQIADLADEDNRIQKRTFEDCTILGPAVLAPILWAGGAFEQNTFENPKILMVAPQNMELFGVIALEGCVFRWCHFRRVGIVGDRDLIEYFRKNLHVLPPES